MSFLNKQIDLNLTWTQMFKGVVIYAVIMPIVLTLAIRGLDNSLPYGSNMSFKEYAEYYLIIGGIYIARIVIPYGIYKYAKDYRAQGMLVYGFKSCIAFEILLLFLALADAALPSHGGDGLAALGNFFLGILLLSLSVLAQIIGMIYGAVHGFIPQRDA